MRHAPSFDHASPAAHIRTLLFVTLAAAAAAPACTSAESHADAGNGTGGSSAGTGGASAGNGGSGTAGAAGHGTGGATGAGGQVSGSGGSATGCGSLPLCDDFESGTLDTTRWTLIPTSNTGTATIDTIGAHGSGHSLKVVSPDRTYLRNSSVVGTLGSVVHVRFYARFMTALPAGHGAIIVTHPTAVDQYAQQPELRFGSQDAVFHWNTDSDAANIPTVGPGDSSSVGVNPNTWYCFELTINSMNGHLNVSINDNDVPGLAEDGVPTANIDQDWIGSSDASLSQSLMRYTAFGDFNFGWESYGGGPMTIWFDDVALSGAQIGCSN